MFKIIFNTFLSCYAENSTLNECDDESEVKKEVVYRRYYDENWFPFQHFSLDVFSYQSGMSAHVLDVAAFTRGKKQFEIK